MTREEIAADLDALALEFSVRAQTMHPERAYTLGIAAGALMRVADQLRTIPTVDAESRRLFKHALDASLNPADPRSDRSGR